MITKNLYLILILLILAVQGCEACVKSGSKEQATNSNAAIKPKEDFSIDPESIFTKINNFTYKSDLTITLGLAGTSKDSHEHVEIIAHAPVMLLKKKIDDFNFLEIFSEGDQFLVKNQSGPWRKGDDKTMYKTIMTDALNMTAWVISEFSLDKQWTGDKKSWAIKDAPLVKDSAFFQNLMMKYPQFSMIERSAVSCSIIWDESSTLPVSMNFDLNLIGQDQHSIAIKANMAFDLYAREHNILRPQVFDDQPMAVPVNISPRFNELMNRELNKR